MATGMQRQRKKRPGRAFTLVEMMVAIAIAVILVSLLVVSGKAIRTGGQIKVTKTTVQLMVNALQEYKEARDNHTGNFTYPLWPLGNLGDLAYTYNDMLTFLFDYGFPVVNDNTKSGSHGNYWGTVGGLPLAEALGLERAQARIEFLYYCLDDVPASRSVLDRLPGNKVANADGDSVIVGDGTGRVKQLIEVIDAWKRPLAYRWQGPGNFPVIISAGPDQRFDTADDILSSELRGG